MATYVLIPGAGCGPWYWHLLEGELRDRGHDVVAVDLPCDDDAAGLPEYVDTAVAAVGDRTGLIVVAHSLGGFTGPLVCARLPVDLLVMLQAMPPLPGEPPGDWWANTGYQEAMREHRERDDTGAYESDDFDELFYNDVPPELAAGLRSRPRDQSGTPMEKPWPLDAWPDVPTRFLLCSEDLFFPPAFMRRVVRDRLGIVPDEIAAGHLPMLSRPRELADRLEAYRAQVPRRGS
ncbi:alpha/beta hydrolase [Sphaerisporangium sp. TRM90804]|uniref:alpha/beta hydrolase n=1 Tax=Sphaerisporangium sp. TRM90804 TaxID=3031113 RepID=UPI002447EA6C|nr:alpha/beta hydrolase [Sphaerisporangium sp. TRM90804]MDH2423899.1 alpha/beta hydrolase [Sphaerisporangium sp. TRM90804]